MSYLSEIFPSKSLVSSWIGNYILIPCADRSVIYLLIVAFEVLLSIVFAIFSVFLFVDQIKAIRYDLSYVEYLKQYKVRTMEVGICCG